MKLNKLTTIIYSLLALLPLCAVGVSCLSVVFNDSYNNTQETIVEYEYETNKVNTAEDLHIGNMYKIVSNETTDLFDYIIMSNGGMFEFTILNNLTDEFYFLVYSDNYNLDYDVANPLCKTTASIVAEDDDTYVITYGIGDTRTYYDSVTDSLYFYGTDLYIVVDYISDDFFTGDISAVFAESDYLPISSVGSSSVNNADIFYYAIDKVEESNVFNWSNSSFTYDTLNDFCGVFGCKDTFISFYMNYVLTISLCYLGFEVLMTFLNMARSLLYSFNKEL